MIFSGQAEVWMPPEKPKAQLTVRFDADIVDWFRKQGRGYQTRMNAVLRAYENPARPQTRAQQSVEHEDSWTSPGSKSAIPRRTWLGRARSYRRDPYSLRFPP